MTDDGWRDAQLLAKYAKGAIVQLAVTNLLINRALPHPPHLIVISFVILSSLTIAKVYSWAWKSTLRDPINASEARNWAQVVVG